MKRIKKVLSLLMALLLSFSVFAVSAAALDTTENTGFTWKETAEHRFYQTVDRLIVGLGAVLNAAIPGLNWAGKIPQLSAYTPEAFYPGKAEFDAAPAADAKWQMGFAAASFLENIDPMDGSFYLAGALAATEGKAPKAVLDDQGVNAFALSDGSTTVAFAAIDGFGLTRGDVQEIRSRLAVFASEHKIASINVSSLHQHSCIDTLGLGAPIVPALFQNPTAILFGKETPIVGRNPVFMEALYCAVTNAVKQAVESMTPGALYYGSTDISEHICDKRDPQQFDGLFHRLRFVPDDKAKNEVWVGQAAIHPTTVGSGGSLSADYPHYIEQYVKTHADADFVFFQGAELAISSYAHTFSYDPDGPDNARAAAMGETLGRKLAAIDQEQSLSPLLNIAIREATLPVKNPIHIIAGREDLLASVLCRKGLGYVIVTELGYMELGGKLGVALVPGEIEPAILWGGAATKAESWSGTSWDYAPWAETCGAERLLCIGLCNDQIGYILCDNDYRSMLTENEEINAISNQVGSQLTEAFAALVAEVK